jgi:predicted RNA binding protein YcfA (HicA-like mRNA interferase family)
MPKFLLSKQVIKVLESFGFILVSQKGSHAKFRKGSQTVIVPIHNKEIPIGTFSSIVRQSNLQKDDFINYK